MEEDMIVLEDQEIALIGESRYKMIKSHRIVMWGSMIFWGGVTAYYFSAISAKVDLYPWVLVMALPLLITFPMYYMERKKYGKWFLEQYRTQRGEK